MATRLCEFAVAYGIPFFCGYMVVLLGALVGVPALMSMNARRASYLPPEGVTEADWKRAAEIDDDQRLMITVYGWMEATYFFLALWLGAPVLIGGWLVFKLGSKWEVWQTIIKVPSDGEELNAHGIKNLASRNRWGSKVFLAHIMGPLGNILVAAIAVGIGRLIAHVAFGQPLLWLPGMEKAI